VDAQTGKIRWHFQLNPADDWDRAAYENMLVDLVINGRARKALILTGKIGWGVVLDRQTGEFLQAFRTAYDNVVTGWTPQGRPIIDPRSIPTPADVDSGKIFEVCPHLHGARNLQAPSYSPITRLYYLGVNNSCMDARVVSTKYVVGRGYTGVTFTTRLAPGYDYVGEFVAFNPVTGARAWTYRPPSGAAMTASALATGGGIVFGGTADRQLFALHSETGELLWQTRLSGDVSGAPVTFDVGGRQYLAIGVGGRTGPTTSFAPLTNTDLSQGTGVITVFALPENSNTTLSSRGRSRPVLTSTSGAQTPAVAAAAANVAAAVIPRGSTRSAMDGVFTIAQASRGEQHFKQACESCHKVAEQTGTTFNAKWGSGTLADLFTAISKTMPQGRPGSLTADAYSSIVAFYLKESGFPAGTAELPADPDALTNVRVR
jgi:outer membrane protein assembly factor BamB